MRFIAGNSQHVGARAEQQDSFGFSSSSNRDFLAHGGFLGVLTDGMGGLEHGRAASQRCVKAFVSYYEDKISEESIPNVLLRSARLTNEELNAWKDANHITAQVGTTLAACVVHDEFLYWISIGDSSIYVYRDQQLVLLTEPHIFAKDLEIQVKRGEISESAARAHDEKDALTSYVGLGTLERIDRNVKPFRLFAGHKILLCSDGLDKTLSPEEISEEMQGSAPAICERLVQKTLTKQLDHQDNVTVMALDCIDSKEFVVGPAPPPIPPAGKTPLLKNGAGKNKRILAILIVALVLLLFFVWRYSTKPSDEQDGSQDANVVSSPESEPEPSDDSRTESEDSLEPDGDGAEEQSKDGIDGSPK